MESMDRNAGSRGILSMSVKPRGDSRGLGAGHRGTRVVDSVLVENLASAARRYQEGGSGRRSRVLARIHVDRGSHVRASMMIVAPDNGKGLGWRGPGFALRGGQNCQIFALMGKA